MPEAEASAGATAWRGWGAVLGRVALAAGLGGVAGLGQVPWSLWPLTILALAAILHLALRASTAAGAALVAWAAGAGYFGLTLSWIVEPFYVDPDRDGWMAPFAIVLLANGLALFWGGGVWAGRRIAPRRGWPTLLGLVAGLAAVEALRSLILTGFPWALLGHIWIETPIAQASAYVGPHGLTLITLGLAASLAGLWRSPWQLAPAFLLAGAWWMLDPGPAPPPEADAPLVRMVQPNAAQDQKWQPGMAEVFFDRLLTLTAGGARPDLVVWPETAIPWLLEYAHVPLAQAAEAARGVPLVLGLQRREEERYYNSLAVLGADGQVGGLYDKVHLVPFGEYVPLGELMAGVGIEGVASSEGGGYSAGPGPTLLGVPGIGFAIPLICYEGIFAEEIVGAPRARLMLLITNDAWFGQNIGPFQHFALARLRAIEQGLPMVRVANTGVSGMIDAKGRVTASLGLGEAGALDAVLPQALPPPPYTVTGDWPALVLIGLLGLLALVLGRRFPIDADRPAT